MVKHMRRCTHAPCACGDHVHIGVTPRRTCSLPSRSVLESHLQSIAPPAFVEPPCLPSQDPRSDRSIPHMSARHASYTPARHHAIHHAALYHSLQPPTALPPCPLLPLDHPVRPRVYAFTNGARQGIDDPAYMPDTAPGSWSMSAVRLVSAILTPRERAPPTRAGMTTNRDVGTQRQKTQR
ncbi:hypothetical protein HYPSUDRAFT_894705 [Hypholoma sublateritium FD-334 SS-4]|uniref:Uncharacterized protein n=1 Tax=Hypholoma sublateritium (strain FD-334 SS-4) TaxID=945553 RepID=A0A0D2KXL2_HYPSF|nr:hypothetical protein HYPSUDRAFT_894705 [Hypholoma sublateritium FD-334 SS-4]